MHTKGVFLKFVSDDFGVYALCWFHVICALLKWKFLYLHKNIYVQHFWIQPRNFQVTLEKESLYDLPLYCTKFPVPVCCNSMSRPPRQYTSVFIAAMFLQSIHYLSTCGISLFIVWTKIAQFDECQM